MRSNPEWPLPILPAAGLGPHRELAQQQAIAARLPAVAGERETLPGGGVQHGTVALAWPGRTLRIIGSLGPLQEMGVAGAMTWQFEKAAAGTTITFTYVVGGYPTMPFEKLAPLVDGVMAVQMKALKAYAERK
ncbi:MAG: hypothetical protein EHM55_25855 [Acidobacteria bacterium]|nr:MAG: hypothetical protein EHM55_25855 [Acidobacteriota bacterium]